MSEDRRVADLLIDMSGWYMETALLEWTLDVDLPRHFKDGEWTLIDLSRRVGIAPDRLGPILDGLVGMSVLQVTGIGYAMPPDIRVALGTGSDSSVAHHVRHHARWWRLWKNLPNLLAVRSAPEPWMQDLSVHEDPSSHELLLRSSAVETSLEERVRMLTPLGLGPDHLLVDLGGGHGRLGIVAADRWCTRTETWDVPSSEAVWSSYADEAEPSVRSLLSFQSVDLVAAVPWRQRPEVTHVVLSHVAANFDGEDVKSLLAKVFTAFPNAVLLIASPWRPHGDSRDPISSLVFDVLIQSATLAGRVHTNDEMRGFITSSGGRVDSLEELDGSALWLCRSQG